MADLPDDVPVSPQRPRRVAVVVVHGVADQKPGESAEAIATMLADLARRRAPRTAADAAGDGGAAGIAAAAERAGQRDPVAPAIGLDERGRPDAYSPFEARELRLPVAPVRLAPREALQRGMVGGEPEPGPHHRFAEHRQYLHRAKEGARGLGYEFMRMQLEHYRGDPAHRVHETRVLGARRAGAAPGRQAGPADDDARRPRDGGGAPPPPPWMSEPSLPPHGAPPRAGDPGRPEVRDVDVYEMYWADLSRLSHGPLAFFGALYQLVLHLATLGRQAVDDAAAAAAATRGDASGGAAWQVTGFAQLWAVRMLALPIVVLNLILLFGGLAAYPAVAAEKKTGAALWVAVALFAIVGAVLSYARGRRRIPKAPVTWALAPLLGLALGALAGWIVCRWIDAYALIGIGWWVLSGIVLFFVMRAYERFRPGAMVAWRWLFVASGAGFLTALAYAASAGLHGARLLEIATLWTMEGIFVALTLAWATLFTFAVIALVAGSMAWRSERDHAARGRARAAVRTGRLSLAVSSGAFLFVTIITWSGVFAWTRDKLGVFACTAPSRIHVPTVLLDTPVRMLQPLALAPDTAVGNRCLVPLGPIDVGARPTGDVSVRRHGASVPNATLTTANYFRGMLVASVTSGLPVSLAITVVALLLLAWMTIPSIRAEVEVPAECNNGQSMAMGRWLSRGLDATAIVTMLLFAAAFIVPTVFAYLHIAEHLVGRDRLYAPCPSCRVSVDALTHWTDALLTAGGALLAASAAVVVAVLVKIGGTAVDILLDVDNYLRTAPADATPRARIAERYVSLLRHLASDDPPGGRYDAIVVIAHSLGALITADLFRFLREEAQLADGGDPALARLGFGRGDGAWAPPIGLHLFTMGAPLRQLLNRFFPHRYDWMRAIPDNGLGPVADPGSALVPRLAWSAGPDPVRLGVARWDNAYRSGDYVGRGFWTDEWYGRNDVDHPRGGKGDQPALMLFTVADGAVRGEMCIGTGAHTHYWDDSAPDVAEHLDYLIATA